MDYSDVIKHFDGVTAAAQQLGMTRAGIYYWQKHPIPYPRQLHIQQVTRGKLKAKANGSAK